MLLPPLFKYLDVRGAKLTLANRNFRHAKPSDFNDTEELTIQSIFPEETEVALKKLRDEFNDVIVQHLADAPTCASPMREKIIILQQVFRNNPAAVEIIKAEMRKEKLESLYDVAHTLPYHPEEISEIYLGLAMEKADEHEIVGIAQAVNPKIAIFRAKENEGGRVEFKPH